MDSKQMKSGGEGSGIANDMRITTSGKEYLSRTSALLATLFRTDPVIRFMTSSLSESQHLAYLPSYFDALLRAAMLNGALFQEANDWASVAVWMLPSKHVDNFWTLFQAGLIRVVLSLGIGGIKRMLYDFQRASDACKARFLARYRGYHYLFFIGTALHARGQGCATTLITRYRQQLLAGEGRGQSQERSAELPIWLEATTAKSRDVYLRCGFEVVEEMVLGKGRHAASGIREQGGPGVSIWAMIWRPPASGDGVGKTDAEAASSLA